jgi:hypothetical protein
LEGKGTKHEESKKQQKRRRLEHLKESLAVHLELRRLDYGLSETEKVCAGLSG